MEIEQRFIEALDWAIERCGKAIDVPTNRMYYAALRELLAMLEQAEKVEPVATVVHHNPPFGVVYRVEWHTHFRDLPDGTKLYTHPPADVARDAPEGFVTVDVSVLNEDWLDAAIKDAGIARDVCEDLDVVLAAGIHAYLLAASGKEKKK